MTLSLLPNLLDENGNHRDFLPSSVDRTVAKLDGLIAESEKAARHYLKRFSFVAPKTFRDIPILLLNEHTKELHALLEPLKQGKHLGLISDAGLPCIADPGHALVFAAREWGIKIEAFVGPSSLILALMLSGLPAQRFAFHGYLDRDYSQIVELEKRSRKERATQLFIEAPYRTEKLLAALIEKLGSDTYLSLAADLTMPSEIVITQKIKEWRKRPIPPLGKKPAIFLINSGEF